MHQDFLSGQVILIHKPYQWTSFDVVRKVTGVIMKAIRASGEPLPDMDNATKRKKRLKIGHAGTLDPLATGLLIICTGKLTKKIDEIVGAEKEYTGTFTLGATTESFDMEHPVNQLFPTTHITPELIQDTVTKFMGTLQQVPPAHSAVKVDGKRAYKLARKGREVIILPKTIVIKEFEITGIEMPLVHFRVVCSKGTYIRALARDFGTAMNTGAYLSALCRTRIGDYKLEEAFAITDFEKQFQTSSNPI